MMQWPLKARDHLAFLEREFPQYFAVPDFIASPDKMDSWRMDQARAEAACGVGLAAFEPKDLEVRNHLIGLLNYFEHLAAAYEQHIIERMVLEETIAPTMMDICVFFQPFITEMRQLNRRDPWPPLSRVIELWLSEADRIRARSAALKAQKRFDSAVEVAKKTFRKTTGA
jgi:hypothetical protein